MNSNSCVMGSEKEATTGDHPAVPDGMDEDRIVISEDETCRFCGGAMWKDLVEEEEHGLTDRWFCTQYESGEHEYEQREKVKDAVELESVVPGEIYSGHGGFVVVNQMGARLSIKGHGMGGCSYENIDVLSNDVGFDLPDYICIELNDDPDVWYEETHDDDLLDKLQAFLDVVDDPTVDVWESLWNEDQSYRDECVTNTRS